MNNTRGIRYAEAAFERELAKLRGAAEGLRNARLNSAAFNLGGLVASGALDADRVTAALTDAALAIGLDRHETERTIRSGLTSGMEAPREVPKGGGNGAGSRRSKDQATRGRVVETYDYVDENDRLLFQVCRYEPKN